MSEHVARDPAARTMKAAAAYTELHTVVDDLRFVHASLLREIALVREGLVAEGKAWRERAAEDEKRLGPVPTPVEIDTMDEPRGPVKRVGGNGRCVTCDAVLAIVHTCCNDGFENGLDVNGECRRCCTKGRHDEPSTTAPSVEKPAHAPRAELVEKMSKTIHQTICAGGIFDEDVPTRCARAALAVAEESMLAPVSEAEVNAVRSDLNSRGVTLDAALDAFLSARRTAGKESR